MDKIKLFCLPYGGGSAVIFKDWKKYIHPSIELHAIELTGRGSRYGTPFYKSMDEAVSDICNMISKDVDSCRYAIFGHSMGSMLSYELAHKLKSLKHPAPLHIFFSGKRPPHIERRNKNIHLLPDEEFMAEIMELGGTPNELLTDKELWEIYIPILKADFKIIETYRHVEKDEKLDCNITILWGKQDHIGMISEVYEWRSYTDQGCKIHLFDGGHFFIKEFMCDVVSIINTQLLQSTHALP